MRKVIGIVMEYVLVLSINVSTCLWTPYDVGEVGPMVSLDMDWPGVVVVSEVGLCGVWLDFPVEREVQVTMYLSLRRRAMSPGNISFVAIFWSVDIGAWFSARCHEDMIW